MAEPACLAYVLHVVYVSWYQLDKANRGNGECDSHLICCFLFMCCCCRNKKNAKRDVLLHGHKSKDFRATEEHERPKILTSEHLVGTESEPGQLIVSR